MNNEGGGVTNCELQVTSYELHSGHSHRRELESSNVKIQKSIVLKS